MELKSVHLICLQPLHDFLTDATREHNENKITLALKAIGNAAQPASLKLVKTVIDSHRYSEYIQAAAVQTMARIGKQEPTKVRRAKESHLDILIAKYLAL